MYNVAIISKASSKCWRLKASYCKPHLLGGRGSSKKLKCGFVKTSLMWNNCCWPLLSQKIWLWTGHCWSMPWRHIVLNGLFIFIKCRSLLLLKFQKASRETILSVRNLVPWASEGNLSKNLSQAGVKWRRQRRFERRVVLSGDASKEKLVSSSNELFMRLKPAK